MPSSQAQDSVLQELAETAGLAVHWENYRNQERSVAPDTLRAVLRALGIAANNEAECRQSLEQLHEEAATNLPGLLVGRAGEELCLPRALHEQARKGATPELVDAQGNGTALRVDNGASGEPCIQLPMEPGYYKLAMHDCRMPLAIAPRACSSVADLTGKQRAWGVGAQLYSLRRAGDGGVGDFTALREFSVDMARAGADGVAVSPVHALFSADRHRYSPYSPSSRLFTNVLYVDPAQVFSEDVVQSCLKQAQLEDTRQRLEREDLIDWPEAARVKLTLLRCLWEQSQAELMDTATELGRSFRDFRESTGDALELHGIFETLHAHHLSRDPMAWHWRDWEPRFRDHTSPAVTTFAAENRQEVLFHCFLQWLADCGLAEAHSASREAGAGIGLIADLAVGTDSGGSHAWSRQEDMLEGLTVGAPPDLLNYRGQDWGLTTFSPRALLAHGYAPMVEMLRASLRHAGGLRIDHILGLRRLWVIPEGAGPEEGAYLHFPQEDLLNLVALESWRHRAIIVGEDLGTIPGNFRQHLAETGLLGMGVLWFEKDNGFFVEPSRWRSTAMATTTTHDLPTIAGWWHGRDLDWGEALDRLPEGRSRQELEQERREERSALWAAFHYAGLAEGEAPEPNQPDAVIDKALAFIGRTPSSLALAPVEDLLGIEEQPNLPGTVETTTGDHPNWRRRLPTASTDIARHEEVIKRLALLAQGREAPAQGIQQD